MIAYDLECLNGHRFEGWFDNAKSFDKQKKKGLVTCPVCGSTEVDRILSTFGIAKHRHTEEISSKGDPGPMEVLIKYVEDNFEDVGADFTKEALKMHYGVTEQRNIRGVSSDKEEETLKEEGISFFKIPMTQNTPSEDE